MKILAQREGKLFIISGPSAAGKGTLCKRIMENSKLCLSISMTTRKPRVGETEGISYYFTDARDFQERIARGEFLEWAKVYDNYYGTPKAKVIEKLKEGMDVILEIDTQGALNVKNTFPDGIFIFILPPSLEELKKRILGRGTESPEAINLRMSKALSEIKLVGEYDYVVVNDDIGKAASQLLSIISAEHNRVINEGRYIIRTFEEEKNAISIN